MKNLICITGPRGAGKEVMTKAVLSSIATEMHISRIVPFTTRNRRPGETHGQELFFIDKEDFFKMENTKDILYSVRIGESDDGNHYFSGTLRSEFNRHENGIIDITVDGARILSHYAENYLLFYIYAYPHERLKRIMNRQKIDEKEARELMTNEPSPGELYMLDKIYPEFTIVSNHDNRQFFAESIIKSNIYDLFTFSRPNM